MDHLRVLVFYGTRQARPDPSRFAERRSFYLWQQAMRVLGDTLEQQGVVRSVFQRAVIDFSLEKAMKASA